MRRPLTALVAAGAAAFALVAGAGSAAAALPKTIQVVTFTPNAPFEFRRGGKLTGFDIQLVERIARTIGITRVQWRPQTTFSKVIPLVAADTYPMAAADITVTAGRAQQLRFRAFGCPHFLAAASWLTERLCGAGRAEFVHRRFGGEEEVGEHPRRTGGGGEFGIGIVIGIAIAL